jgi:hypothetical protein
MKTNETQQVWDALKRIYGKNLEAATINVLLVDGSRVTYSSLVFPNDLKEKDNEDT